MKRIKIKLTNGSNVNVNIEKPELIYGTTAIVSNDIDTSLRGINPVTKEEMKIINLNEKENRFFIPSHIQKDYEYAIKHNLSLKQVIAPYFQGVGEEKLREDKPLQRRKSIIAIIKNNQTDEYLCEKAEGRNCQSFVQGGIEGEETPEEAALREIKEETGYLDVKIDKVSNFKIINHFYAGYKGVNRFSYLNIVFGRLNTDKRNEITEEEKHKQKVLWTKKNELNDFINLKTNKFALDILLNGEKAYTGDGLMITGDENNEKPNTVVRQIIEEKYCL